jgi:glycosyltransferase involved in cell wall biosynthesis
LEEVREGLYARLAVEGEVVGVLYMDAFQAPFPEEAQEAFRLLALQLEAALRYEAVQKRARYLAYHDPLTGLGNRALLEEEAPLLLREGTRTLLLLDLESCDAGYTPTQWQRSRFPTEYQSKIQVIFDGIDTNLWHPRPRYPRRAGRFRVPEDVRLVTYAARGFESIRGFDIFMRFAKKLYDRRPDVRFLVIGEDKVHYGGDLKKTGGQSFKDWVLSQDDYDLSKFAFVGRVAPDVLAQAFSITDLHVYLTVPFVLSWSLLNAMACGATILASDTPPVREVIRDQDNGLLVDFFDVEVMAEIADRVLRDPESYRPLGQRAIEDIRTRYSLDVCLPQLVDLFERTASRSSSSPS